VEDTSGPAHIPDMITTTAGTTGLDIPPGSPESAPDAPAAGIRRRANTALADAGMTIESLSARIPMPSSGWHAKIVSALTGEGRFTSLTLALFAEAVGVDVLWLITGKQPPVPTVIACVVDESVGAETAAVAR